MSSPIEKYAVPAAALVAICLVIAWIYWRSEGLASPDGVVARRSQRQARSDVPFDSWDDKKLEACVRDINARA
jgi:hypothetical protein